MNFSKGFTLIELLIVITIIGILAVALLPSVLGAPARARDAARKADLNNIITAVEAYNSDNQGYPTARICFGTDATLDSYFQGGKAPKDPQGGSAGNTVGGCAAGAYAYCPMTSPNNYYLAAYMEILGDANAKATEATDCNAGAVGAPTMGGASDTDSDRAYIITK